MKPKTKYAFAIVTAAILLGGIALSIRARQSETNEKKGASSEAAEKHKAEGVKLDTETRERIGLRVQPLQSLTIRSEVTVYGTLEADPSEEIVLRAQYTGVLESEGQWPAVGSRVAQGTSVGSVRPLYTPMDQIGLSERLASARADLESASAAVLSGSEAVSRLKQLNTEDKNVSDKALQEAETQLAAEEAKVKSAQASIELISATLRPRSNLNVERLEAQKAGQVTEIGAQPGESVQAGQALLRISRFDHLLARLYVPPGEKIPPSATRALIYPADESNIAIPAERAALAGSIDPRYQGQIFLFRLAPGKVELRPGQAVTGRLAVPGPATRGVLIPSSAILRFEGETWVYVESGSGEFVRRMAPLDQLAKGGWVLKSGFAPGDRVVITGAQTLLSEEMKSQLESDAE
jgi:RND family efflux transporter MFP subunit